MKSLSLLPMLMLTVLIGCSKDDAGGTATMDPPGATSPNTDSAEATMRSIQDGMSNNQPVVVWNAMPETYQADVNGLVQTFGTNMDPELWQQITGLVKTVHTLLSEKQEFIFNHPGIAESEDPAAAKKAIVQITELLNTVLTSMGDLESFKSFDGEKFMTTTGTEFSKQINVLSTLAQKSPAAGAISISSLKDIKIETVESTDTTATLKMTDSDGKEELQEFVKHEGKWLPKTMVDEWDQKLAEAKESLAGLPEQSAAMKGQFMMVGGMVNGALAPLQSAATQEQFNAAVDSAMAMVGPMLGGFGGPPSFGSPEPPPPEFETSPGSSPGSSPTPEK